MSLASNQLFNSAIVCSSISASFELGIFDSKNYEDDFLPLETFCRKEGLDLDKVTAILNPMIEYEIFNEVPGKAAVKKGKKFQDISENMGYFHWMVKGYSEMLGKTAYFAKPDHDIEARRTRDGAAIARAGRDYSYISEHMNYGENSLIFL